MTRSKILDKKERRLIGRMLVGSFSLQECDRINYKLECLKEIFYYIFLVLKYSHITCADKTFGFFAITSTNVFKK